MFDPLVVGLTICLYVAALLAVAHWGEGQAAARSWLSRSGWVYSLSMAVYCTTWTYYGSVGKAANSGPLYLAIYTGPTLCIIFWWTILRKLVRAKSRYRITSIADFLSARYGKSHAVAALATIIALVGTVPYIALQLKAMDTSFALVSDGSSGGASSWLIHNIGPLMVVLICGFTILFGGRRLDPTERHQGIMFALATECVVKLIAFAVAGLFVTYALYNGVGDILTRVEASHAPSLVAARSSPPLVTWITYTVLSMSAVLFLPRQFHVSVVENSDERHIRVAQWVFPLYMLLINLFVTPIAWGGLLAGHPAARADTFVLLLPLASGQRWLSLLVFLGGFSAGMGMLMITPMTMSTMVTNHLLLPLIQQVEALRGMRRHLLRFRWAVLALFILAGHWFATTVGDSYMLVNIGMMSFAAVLQFAPAGLGGLFWKEGNKQGAIAGMAVGFSLWVYTLLIPSFVKSGWLSSSLLEEGLFGIGALRPEHLFGLSGVDQLTHSVFWSMLGNIGCYVLGSILARPDREEQALAQKFVSLLQPRSPAQAPSGSPQDVVLAEKVTIVRDLFSQYMSADDAEKATGRCLTQAGVKGGERISILELGSLRTETERVLSGSIGAASARYAVQRCGLFSQDETERLSVAYSGILTQLAVTPEELQRKVDYYQERNDLVDLHARELEKNIAELQAEFKQRVRAETAMRESQVQLQSIIDNTTSVVYVRDLEGRFILVNNQFAQLFQVDRDAIRGRRNRELFRRDLAEAIEANDDRAMEGDVAVECEQQMPHLDRTRTYLSAKFPLHEASGTPYAICAVLTDITDRKRAEEEVARHRDRLEDIVGERTAELKASNAKLLEEIAERKQLQASLTQADRMASVGLLAAGVAHEINNPLTYVLHNLESLAQDLPPLSDSTTRLHRSLFEHLDAETASKLIQGATGSAAPEKMRGLASQAEAAIEGAKRVRKIVRDLKTFSRVDEGEDEPVQVNDVIAAAANMCFHEIKYRAQLVTEYGELPMVMANEGRLSQVFLNLLMNAVQAIEEGSLSKNEIRVRTWSDGEWVMAEVQDTGIGIPPENIPHLFEPFFTTKDVGVGSGLGLSICHNMISAYKGHIHVESKVGKGSRFVVSLPAWRQPRKASVSAEFALATTTAPARGRILIVDDERDICDAVQHMLSDEHEVLVATSGPAAKVILEQDVSFDVVVCDLMMPGVTGIDLYQWVRKRDADLAGRMLFITGGAFTPLARAFLRDVPNRYLEKPFESAALRSAIVELIARLRSAPEGA